MILKRKNMNGFVLAASLMVIFMIPRPAAASDTGTPTKDLLSNAYTGKVYSPYAKRGIPERPLWGDTHLHTSLSMDAGLFGNRLSPSEAYRFARRFLHRAGGAPVASPGLAGGRRPFRRHGFFW